MELVTTTGPYMPLIVALLLGMLLGVERTFAGKTAGMRTYGLVSTGSALFVVISQIVLADSVGIASFDPMRVPSAIITGVGFIGAGLILFRHNQLKGLTTAAGLWVACGVGIASGMGLYAIAGFATFLTLFVFTGLWFVENRIKAFRHIPIDVQGYEKDSK